MHALLIICIYKLLTITTILSQKYVRLFKSLLEYFKNFINTNFQLTINILDLA